MLGTLPRVALVASLAALALAAPTLEGIQLSVRDNDQYSKYASIAKHEALPADQAPAADFSQRAAEICGCPPGKVAFFVHGECACSGKPPTGPEPHTVAASTVTSMSTFTASPQTASTPPPKVGPDSVIGCPDCPNREVPIRLLNGQCICVHIKSQPSVRRAQFLDNGSQGKNGRQLHDPALKRNTEHPPEHNPCGYICPPNQQIRAVPIDGKCQCPLYYTKRDVDSVHDRELAERHNICASKITCPYMSHAVRQDGNCVCKPISPPAGNKRDAPLELESRVNDPKYNEALPKPPVTCDNLRCPDRYIFFYNGKCHCDPPPDKREVKPEAEHELGERKVDCAWKVQCNYMSGPARVNGKCTCVPLPDKKRELEERGPDNNVDPPPKVPLPRLPPLPHINPPPKLTLPPLPPLPHINPPPTQPHKREASTEEGDHELNERKVDCAWKVQCRYMSGPARVNGKCTCVPLPDKKRDISLSRELEERDSNDIGPPPPPPALKPPMIKPPPPPPLPPISGPELYDLFKEFMAERPKPPPPPKLPAIKPPPLPPIPPPGAPGPHTKRLEFEEATTHEAEAIIKRMKPVEARCVFNKICPKGQVGFIDKKGQCNCHPPGLGEFHPPMPLPGGPITPIPTKRDNFFSDLYDEIEKLKEEKDGGADEVEEIKGRLPNTKNLISVRSALPSFSSFSSTLPPSSSFSRMGKRRYMTGTGCKGFICPDMYHITPLGSTCYCAVDKGHPNAKPGSAPIWKGPGGTEKRDEADLAGSDAGNP
ncbi:MAG: hypothetical protein Q9218_001078 [Villophora microphyllina]